MDKTILVSGITGRQGGSVAGKLKSAGWNVKGLSRTIDSPEAKKLVNQGFEIAQGDMSNIPSLERAMRGCYGVYSVQNYWEYGREKEILFGKNMVIAARKSSIEHFVFGSCQSCDRKTGVEHFDSKFETEKEIHESGIPATIIRPVAFIENYYIRDVYKRILNGRLSDPVSGNKPQQIVATEDIGNYVTAVFNRPNLIGRTFDIIGDELTNLSVSEMMTEIMGFPVKFQRFPLPLVRILMGKEFYTMFSWLDKVGFNAKKDVTEKLVPEVKPMNLHDWLLKENWNRWNKKGKF